MARPRPRWHTGAPELEPPQTEAGEDHIIHTVTAQSWGRLGAIATRAARVGPGDDAAVLRDGTVVTVDTLVQGVHWDHRLTPEHIGYKCVAVSVSDVAAMGAVPTWAVLSLSLPAPHSPDWVAAFSAGLRAACERFGVAIVGGDTTRGVGARVISVTMGGVCDTPVLRSGAHPGDHLWITGTLGLAAAGWQQELPCAAALDALRSPNPPVAFASAVARAGLATAMMDLSDGLARDLPRLCRASHVGAQVHADQVPVDPALDPTTALSLALTGGEDYQLLITASPTSSQALSALAATHHVALTRVGALNDTRTLRLDDGAWPVSAFEHFAAVTP